MANHIRSLRSAESDFHPKRFRRARIVYNGDMTVTILFFASVAEALGLRKLVVPVQPNDTVGTVRDRLTADYPALARFVPNLLYALDEEYVRPSSPIGGGATLALIPPVSGGC